MSGKYSLSIKELHAKTGELVRKAALSQVPIEITDRGKPIAVLISPVLAQKRKRTRVLLPEYQAYLKKKPYRTYSILDDLSAVRDDRSL
jgi:prevent-host-death family protein